MGVDEVLSETIAKLESALAPINGGVGEDASYDPEFEAIKTELDRGSSIEGGSTNWNEVESKSFALLSERSKDFRVALYYTVAATMNRQIPGLFEGLLVMNELADKFWEPMYPALKRPRARGNLCSWLSEMTTPIAQKYTPTAQQRDLIKALERTFRQLDGFLADKLGEAYPGMMTLRDAVNALPHRVPADAPPPPPPPPPPEPKAAGPVSSGTPSVQSYAQPTDGGYAQTDTSQVGGGAVSYTAASITDPSSAYQALAEIAPLLSAAGDAVLSYGPSSADGFRLKFTGACLLIGGAPYNEGGQTQVEGPAEHVVQGLNDLAAAQDWMNLATTATQAFGANPMYLDAARHLFVALGNLGDEYAIAKNVVSKEAASLLARAPELPTLYFSNGIGFASDETKQWAKDIAAGGGGGGGKASPIDKAAADADKLFAAGQVPQAVQLLSRLATQVSSPMHKFRARLEIAKVCVKGQLLDIARAQLETLERVAEEHRLAAWDPELCAEMYANLYRVRRAQSFVTMDDAELPKKVAQSLQRLCELDAAQALQVMQETPA